MPATIPHRPEPARDGIAVKAGCLAPFPPAALGPADGFALPMRIVVLGVGNILLSDEGVGVRAIEELGRRYDLPPEVILLDGGTSAMEMLDDLADADLLIIADCVRAGLAPGSHIRLGDDEVPALLRLKMSPHQIGLSDVLATLVLSGESPKRIVVHGVEPASLATAMALTPVVEGRLPDLVAALAEELRSAGVALTRRVPPETPA